MMRPVTPGQIKRRVAEAILAALEPFRGAPIAEEDITIERDPEDPNVVNCTWPMELPGVWVRFEQEDPDPIGCRR